MNIINITPIKDRRNNCAEDILASIAAWLGRDYQLMFSSSLNFNYKNNLATIGEGIVIEQSQKYELLEEYHGINVNIVRGESKKIINIIISELNRNKPVGVAIDSFFCPWDNNYKIEHNLHHCLIVGYNKDFIVTDPFYKKQNVILPIENFNNGCNFYCATYSIKKEINKKDEEYYNDVLKKCLDIYLRNDPFAKMRELANDILTRLDFRTELGVENNIWESHIVQNLGKLATSRNEFDAFLNYVFDKSNFNNYKDLCEKFSNLGLNWGSVQGKVAKMFIKKDIEYATSISNSILEVSNREEEAINRLYEFFTKSVSSNSGIVKSRKNRLINKSSFIDLSNYYNEKIFGTNQFPIDFEDGRFFLVNDFPIKLKMDSQVILFSQNDYNSVSCRSQTIDIERREYLGLTIIGFSTWGNHSAKITLMNDNKIVDFLSFDLSDWYFDAPFGENIFSTYPIAKNDDGNVISNGQTGNIFSKLYSFNDTLQINSLKLPYEPEIHIMGVIIHYG